MTIREKLKVLETAYGVSNDENCKKEIGTAMLNNIYELITDFISEYAKAIEKYLLSSGGANLSEEDKAIIKTKSRELAQEAISKSYIGALKEKVVKTFIEEKGSELTAEELSNLNESIKGMTGEELINFISENLCGD